MKKKEVVVVQPQNRGKCDGHYRIHKPNECFGKSKRKAEGPKEDDMKKLKLADALQAITDSLDDEERWE